MLVIQTRKYLYEVFPLVSGIEVLVPTVVGAEIWVHPLPGGAFSGGGSFRA